MNPTFTVRPIPADITEYTVLVLGAYRGGTSVAACALHSLGLHTGSSRDNPVYEDLELGAALLASDWAAAEAMIHEKNSRYATWCWKSPALLDRLDDVLPRLRSPVLVCVHRDPVAILGRELERRTQSVDLWQYVTGQCQRLADISATSPLPTLAVSCERARRDPSAFVADLVAFLRWPADGSDQRRTAWRLLGGYHPPSLSDD